MINKSLLLDHGLFGRLRRDAGTHWKSYVAHDFVLALGRGTLPEAAFRHFLVQDYLFLIQFARAHAPRYPQLLATFIAATKLEEAFWSMGWRAGQVTRDG